MVDHRANAASHSAKPQCGWLPDKQSEWGARLYRELLCHLQDAYWID
jgi:hypothetical protein